MKMLVKKTDGTNLAVVNDKTDINFIYLNPGNKCFNLCDEESATGIAVDGNPYQIKGKVLKDGLDEVEYSRISDSDAETISAEIEEAKAAARAEEEAKRNDEMGM